MRRLIKNLFRYRERPKMKRHKKYELIVDVTKVHNGQMSVMYFCKKWQLPYDTTLNIIYREKPQNDNKPAGEGEIEEYVKEFKQFIIIETAVNGIDINNPAEVHKFLSEQGKYIAKAFDYIEQLQAEIKKLKEEIKRLELLNE